MDVKRIKILWIHETANASRLADDLITIMRQDTFEITRYCLDSHKPLPAHLNLNLPGKRVPDLFMVDLVSKHLIKLLSLNLRREFSRVPAVVLTDEIEVARDMVAKGFQESLRRSHLDLDQLVHTAQLAMERKSKERSTDIISMVSHELRTPIAIVREGIAQVKEGLHGSVNETQNQFLGISLNGLDRLRRMVDEVLDSARVDRGEVLLKRSAVSMTDLVQQVADGLKPQVRKKDLKMTLLVPDQPLMAFADSDKVTQVLTNLIVNALKFTHEGRITVALDERDAMIECSVSDTGRGIAQEDLPNLFGKFKQFGQRLNSAERGLGLGLSIVKGIVEKHKGQIRVESELGKGTTFVFTLPKYSVEEDINDYIHANLASIPRDAKKLSMIIFDTDMPQEMKHVESLMRSNLRDKVDKIFNTAGSTMAVLNGVDKKDAQAVAKRICGLMGNKLKASFSKETKLPFNVVSFPEDASTAREFLKKAIQ